MRCLIRFNCCWLGHGIHTMLTRTCSSTKYITVHRKVRRCGSVLSTSTPAPQLHSMTHPQTDSRGIPRQQEQVVNAPGHLVQLGNSGITIPKHRVVERINCSLEHRHSWPAVMHHVSRQGRLDIEVESCRIGVLRACASMHGVWGVSVKWLRGLLQRCGAPICLA